MGTPKFSSKEKMPFYRRYRHHDRTDARRTRGSGGSRVRDHVDFLRDFKQWRNEKYNDQNDRMNDKFDYEAYEAESRKIELINDALDIIKRIKDRRDGGCCANIKEKLEDMKEQAEEAAAKAADMVTEKLDQAKEQAEKQLQQLQKRQRKLLSK